MEIVFAVMLNQNFNLAVKTKKKLGLTVIQLG